MIKTTPGSYPVKKGTMANAQWVMFSVDDSLSSVTGLSCRAHGVTRRKVRS